MPPGERRISVVIPNRNGAATIERCLEAVLASRYGDFEVIVVDDASDDDSPARIRAFPCRLVRLKRRRGAAGARNAGAGLATGEILFFLDADCVVEPGTLARVNGAMARRDDPRVVVGGSYTPVPFDPGFFSTFQSVFVHHFETRAPEPDYLPGHALAIRRTTFLASGGFPEDPGLPLIEDVAFSHRLRGAGCRLVMDPEIRVRHIFRFTLRRSLRNAARKARHWTRYSLARGDVWADSGTASHGLKVNAAAWLAGALCLALGAARGGVAPLLPAALLPALAALANRGLVAAFHRAGGPGFALLATAYYTLVYPLPVWAGALAGTAGHLAGKARGRRG